MSKDSSAAIDPAPAVESVASPSEVFDVLSAARRQQVLRVLAEASPPTDVETLARAVAARETDRPAEPLPAARVRRVQVSLHHVHLPKLAATGLVEYDPDRGLVVDAVDGLDSLLPSA